MKREQYGYALLALSCVNDAMLSMERAAEALDAAGATKKAMVCREYANRLNRLYGHTDQEVKVSADEKK
jgi:hypothetical protein